MAKNIYVGNLPWECTSDELLQLFQPHGQVKSAQVIIDRESNRSRGFAFVEMSKDEEGAAAIAALNGSAFKGRPLTVNEARPRAERPPRTGYGADRGYGAG
jgi:RNA recognition motif-containing protein